MRAENGDPVWPVSRQAISVGRTTNLLRLGSSASPAHSRIPLPSHGTDNRKWYKRSTEAANKCSRREKFLALRPLYSCRERKRERADRFDAPLKVNNRLETPATTPIFFPKRDEIFSSQLLLSPRSFPARKRETRDSLYRVLYRFLHQLSRSNRFFIQFMYASHHFKAQVWKFGDARERQGGLQRFEKRRWLLKSLSEANLSFPAFYFRIYPRILGVRESRRNIGQSGPSLNNRSRLRYKAWCLLRFGKVSHSGAENLINRRPEETGSFVLAC